jgi:hypothetical protein
MNKTNELICAHSGLVFAALMGLGIFGVAGWMPLIQPGMGAEDLQALVAQDRMRIRIGISIMAFSSALWWTFAAAISMQMKRIEGDSHPLTYVQMGTASGTAMVVLLASYFWLAAAYRAETPASTLQLFNDIAWLLFIGAYPAGFIQTLSIGLCILTNKTGQGVYPRWVGFANIWIAILFLPGALLPFFKSGPFAWNGIIGFWLVALCFFGWIVLMWWATVRAIKNGPDN